MSCEHCECEQYEVIEDIEWTTSWGVPWWLLFTASFGGGLTVLLAFWIIATVVG